MRLWTLEWVFGPWEWFFETKTKVLGPRKKKKKKLGTWNWDIGHKKRMFQNPEKGSLDTNMCLWTLEWFLLPKTEPLGPKKKALGTKTKALGLQKNWLGAGS